MRPPCEIVVRFYLPYVRAKVIKKLIEEYGWKPSEVSKKLGISLPAVTKYKKLIQKQPNILGDSIDDLVNKLTEMAVTNAEDTDLILTLCEGCLMYRMSNRFLEWYKKSFPGKELSCHFCSRWISLISEKVRERLNVLRDVDRALFTVLSERGFVKIIPEVRSNIAMALREAKGPNDVVAIPGRITVVRGRPYATFAPEFGASKHLSKILLEVMKFFKDIRGIMCIKFNKRIEEIMKELNFSIVYVIREEPSDEKLLRAIRGKLVILKKPPDAIVDRGCIGIEPITYILGKSASDVVEKVTRIIRQIEKHSSA